MAIEGINGIQATQMQAPQMAQVQPKVEVEAVAPVKPVVEDVKVNTEDAGSDKNREYSNEQIKKAVEQMNKNMYNSEAVFGIHEGTNRVTIKIVDKDTKEVIKELPPEKTLDMIAKVWEMAGLLVDEKR